MQKLKNTQLKTFLSLIKGDKVQPLGLDLKDRASGKEFRKRPHCGPPFTFFKKAKHKKSSFALYFV